MQESLPREKSKKSQGKRKASFASESARPKKCSWTSEAVEILLKYIKEFKTKCEFNSVDFEADLSTMYTEIRRRMAVDFAEDFGPKIVHELGKDKILRLSAFLLALYLATAQLSHSAPNSIIAIALGTRLLPLIKG